VRNSTPSISRTGVTSAAVPVRKISSARIISSRVKALTEVRTPASSARRRMVSRVMPGTIDEVSSLVHSWPSRTKKTFSPVALDTVPS
jgi:hypothetical protein